MKKVTGIGGVFFKVENPEKTRNWYRDHLGLNTDEYGTNFEWRETGGDKGFTQWSPFKSESTYFQGEFMVNYRVSDLAALVEDLREKGVEILDDIVEEDYGKFVHIRDGDGQAVELWEPVTSAYDEMVPPEGRTK